VDQVTLRKNESDRNGERLRAEGEQEKDKRSNGAIVVGVLLGTEDLATVEGDLTELQALLRTLGIDVKEKLIQRRPKPTADLLLGSGKAEEIRDLAKLHGCSLVVIDRPLSAPQVRNLEEITCCEVLDRAGIILDIFDRHARTKQAKLQVEIAKLEYLLPRLTGAWTHFQRQTGGVNSRGMGEKQIEIDRRRARERIARLQKQLEQISKERSVQRKGRQNELKVALVGYTNSGKTTIMKALTQGEQEPVDALFATLDSSVRSIDPNTRPKILLSDTVGFIRNLPHSLIESFKSTLEVVIEADMLLHVVDTSHDNYRAQMETTTKVLQEIGASEIPICVVFNKWDQVDDPILAKIMTQGHADSICVSAQRPGDIQRLRRHVYEYFESRFQLADIRVPAVDRAAMSIIHSSCLILDEDYSENDQVLFRIRAPDTVIQRLQNYVYQREI
jgi:GTPase